MSVDFPGLLYGLLPGVYRDKDELGELVRFLRIGAGPLEEINACVEQLYADFFLASCRDTFLPLIGGLLGLEIDTTQPAWVQRAEVSEALDSYRRKGLRDTLAAMANHLTRLHVETVDFSALVAQSPFLQDANPLLRRRARSVGEAPAGSGNFFFSADQRIIPLYDAQGGRPITREALTGNEALFAGADGRFSIQERGVDIFHRTAAPLTAVAADLTDFAHPKTAGGAALAISAGQVAVDPVLGRFRVAPPIPLAATLTVDYQELVPASLARQTFDISDPSRMVRLGRIDDPAPYTLDVRAPRTLQDKFGRMHFDNHGFFFTFGRVMSNRTPNLVFAGPPSGFTFDDRLLAPGDTQGIALQLLDAFDGSPLTRAKFSGHEAEFCGTARGFTIRINRINITDPAFRPLVRVVAADLTDFTHPKNAGGGPLVLAATDVAVDPELGRVLLKVSGLGGAAAERRVDYLLGPAKAFHTDTPASVAAPLPLFTFTAGGDAVVLRDGFDGTPLSVRIRLGRPITEFHGNARGWIVRRNGIDVSAALPAEVKSLADVNTAATPGRLAVDPDLGRFRFPDGFLAPGDRLSVDFSAEDVEGETRLVDSFAQRAAHLLPAGCVAVTIDTRKTPVDPVVLL